MQNIVKHSKRNSKENLVENFGVIPKKFSDGLLKRVSRRVPIVIPGGVLEVTHDNLPKIILGEIHEGRNRGTLLEIL